MDQGEENIVSSPFQENGITRCDLWTYAQDLFLQRKDSIALIDPLRNISMTFGELQSKIECIATNLMELGHDRDQPVVMYMENCVEVVVTMLAVWRVGGRVATINHLLTSDELHKYLELLGCDIMVCSQATASNACKAIIGSSIKKIICTEDYPDCLSFSKFHSPKGNTAFPKHINPKNTALMVFSSGTTGTPKCVELSHQGLVEVTAGLIEATGINHLSNGGIVYQPLSHIYGVTVLWSFLRCGQKAVLMPQFSLERFVQYIHRYKIEILFLVPPVAVLLCKSPLIKKCHLRSVKIILSGAAPLGIETEDELRKLLNKGARVTQGYGLTELHGGGCLVRHWDSSAPSGSVGKLWPNTMAKVVDLDTGNNLGPGQRGEICFKCNYIMNGYLKNPSATAGMIRNGWLYTGDIGFYDEKGYFFVVDRLKELIKYKGYQVAPSELEAILLSRPAIADAGVTSISDAEAGELPQAWIVLKPGQTCSEADIQAFMTEKVAPFKRLRGGVKFVSAIPKSSSGKIMRRMMKQQATHCKI